MSLPDSLRGKRPTWVEVDLTRLESNFLALRKVLPRSLKNHGRDQGGCIRPWRGARCFALQQLGVDALAVAILEEALVLRKAGVNCSLLLLNGFWPGQEDDIVSQELTPVVFRPDMLHSLEKAAARAKRQVTYHLEVNTGISRLGVDWEEAAALVTKHTQSPWTRCEGVFTHFSVAENLQDGSTDNTTGTFHSGFWQPLSEGGWQSSWRHAANSAGILNFRQSWMDGVRPGLVVFGVNPLPVPQTLLGIGSGPELQDSGDAGADGSAWLFHWIWKFLHRQPGQPDCDVVGGLCRRADASTLELRTSLDPRTASSDRRQDQHGLDVGGRD